MVAEGVEKIETLVGTCARYAAGICAPVPYGSSRANSSDTGCRDGDARFS
jgi:hypothetical protein